MALVVSRGQIAGERRLGLLPAEATSLVGRATELAAVTTLLAGTRMVTVTGPGGVGKTRFSLRAAAAMADQFSDGVWLADLSAVSEPGQVLPAIAAVLGVESPDSAERNGGAHDYAEQDSAVLGAALLGSLRDKKLLLILDTCEHLVDACASFADIVLRAAPGVTLLATSRQPLDAQAEHAFPLPPLRAEDEAVDLFGQRAAAVVPGFTVTDHNRADVERLCRRLDGVPLAIELAAVRLRALPLPQLASQLESGIRTLTVSRRGTTPRHQNLRASVEWSYQLCSPSEQALWQRLSVFAGTFSVNGAEQVCADDALPSDQVIHALVGLVDKSVVLRDAGDPSRYRLIAALREFGADRLAEAGGPGAFLDRLTIRCLAMARDFDERFSGGSPADSRGERTDVQQVAAFSALHLDYANVRAVLDYVLEGAEPARGTPVPPDDLARWRLGAELAVRLRGYWQIAGLLDEGRQWLTRVARLFPERTQEHAWALGARGRLATFQGDLAEAVTDIRTSIGLAAGVEYGADVILAHGYLYLNLALTFTGDYEEAMSAADQARQRLGAFGYRTGVAGLEAQVAHLQLLTGNLTEAIERCDRGLALLGQTKSTRPGSGERWVSGYLHLVSGLALAELPEREHASAKALIRAVIAKYELRDVVGTAYAVEALAWMAADREQYERTAWLIGAADQLWNRVGRRLSGVARMEESRQHAAGQARAALGDRRYTAAYAHGAALDLDTVVREATIGIGEAAPRGLPAAGGAQAAVRRSFVPGLLTKREREIAELVASGLSNREIATRLFISKRTVDAHVEHIFSKLEISSRVQLTVLLQDEAPRAHTARS